MDAGADAEAASAARERAARGNRGMRMRALMEDEEEADEEFWNQDALAEEAEDEEYESESDEEDMVDGDFFRQESSGDEGEAGDEPVEKKKKTLRPPGWVDPRAAPRPPKAAPKPSPRPPGGDGDGGGEGVVSPSTRSVVHAAAPIAMRKSVREAAVIANEARKKITGDGTKRPQKRRKVGDEPALSQAQMLVEAAQTELLNLAHLAQLQAREDLQKQRAQFVKKVYTGPKVRYVSTKDITTIEFTQVSRFPPPLRTKPPKPTNRAVCAITGLPAKYRDPLSGLPYATAAAFKQLRANRTAQAAAAAAAAAASNAANASAQNPTSSAAPAEEAAAPVRTVIKCTLKLPARSAALANPNCPPQPFVVKPAQP